jgi:hypothetical protein
MKKHEFFLLTLAIAAGSFAALIVWTLIVKNQVAATVQTAAAANPVASLLGL